jgi:hypothetical protein
LVQHIAPKQQAAQALDSQAQVQEDDQIRDSLQLSGTPCTSVSSHEKGRWFVVRVSAICLYFAVNACLVLLLDRSVRQQTGHRPKPAELLVYVLAGGLAGLPVVLVVLVSGLVMSFTHRNSLT